MALGHVEAETVTEEARAMVGALDLIEGLHELRQIRRLLSPAKKGRGSRG